MQLMSETRTFEEVLNEDGVLIYTCKGYSMKPLLRQNSDLLVIRRPEREFRKYDIVLYKFNDKYILHRIIDIDNGTIITAGDNNAWKDAKIREDQIIGVLTAVVRDGKEIDINDLSHQVYGHLVTDFFGAKKIYLRIKAKGAKLKNIIKG